MGKEGGVVWLMISLFSKACVLLVFYHSNFPIFCYLNTMA